MDVNNLKKDCVYVLNKNEGIIAVFSKDDEDTIIDPIIEEVQNGEAKLTFQVPATSEKWKNTYNPENLYLVDRKIFSANFSDCIEREREDNGTDLITVVAYERQKLLERQYVRAWNSTTGFETIDEFMVVIVSGGDLDLYNDGVVVQTTYEKGSSGYALAGILAGTGWTVGICDVPGKFDLETDFETVYDNIAAIQELWGGIFVFDSLNKVVHHRDETTYLPYSGFEAKYTKNLQSSKYIGDNKIITKLCPLGEGSLNIKDVNDGSIWLENHSYTMSDLEGIENNDDIYEQDQLKAWGERKLAELCKPRKELTLTTAMLNKVEGYELEEVHLNDIVDVIDYEFTDQPSIQLRVIEYKHYLWNGADAELVIGDITLESTDIFKKAVQATNLINNGTLDTSKIVDYYKNGQSLRRTLRQIDQTIIDTTSELSKTDDEIKASVQQTETRVDNLNNDIVSQNLRIAQLIINVDGITSEVHSMIDLTETITSYNGKITLEDAIKGDLVGLSIHGYDGYVVQFPENDLYPSDTLYPILSQIKIRITTLNLCPTDINKWSQISEYELESDFIDIDPNYMHYISIKGEVYNAKYLISDIISYDENGKILLNSPAIFEWDINGVGNKVHGETAAAHSLITLQNGVFCSNIQLYVLGKTKKIKIRIVKEAIANTGENIHYSVVDEYISAEFGKPTTSTIYSAEIPLMPIGIAEIEYAKPMLEKCEKIIGTNALSGELPDDYIKLNYLSNLTSFPNETSVYNMSSIFVRFTNTCGFEITFKQHTNVSNVDYVDSGSNCIYTTLLATNAETGERTPGFALYNRYENDAKHKRFLWNKTWYDIYTENDYTDVITTITFTTTYFQGSYIYTLNFRDEEGHNETFDLDLPQEEFESSILTIIGCFDDMDSPSGTSILSKRTDFVIWDIYSFKMYQDSTLIRDYRPALNKTTQEKLLYEIINGNKYYSEAGCKTGGFQYFIPPQNEFSGYNNQEYTFNLDEDLRSMDVSEVLDISSKNIEDYEAGIYNQNDWLEDEKYISNKTMIEVQPGQKLHFISGLPFEKVSFYNYNETYLGDNEGLFSLKFDEDTTEATIQLFSGIRYVSFAMKKDEETSLEDAFEEANLRVFVTNIVYDEFMMVDNKATLIRRIGVDDQDNKYVLTEPTYEDMGALQISLAEGENYLEVIDYEPTLIVQYAKQNQYTEKYATKAELNSKIQQTNQSILLEVSKKIDTETIIASINTAIEGDKGVVRITGNHVIIDSDYFHLTADGEITATKGTIAGLILTRHKNTYSDITGKQENWSVLKKVYKVGNKYYMNALTIADSAYGADFLIAGMQSDDEKGSWLEPWNASLRILSDGKIKMQSNCGSQKDKDVAKRGNYISLNDTASNVETFIGSGLVDAYYIVAGEGGVKGSCLHGRDMNHSYTCAWNGSNLYFYVDNTNVGSISDERLKSNIEDIDDNVIKAIDEIQFKQFNVANKPDKISFGAIAQHIEIAFEKYGLDWQDYLVLDKVMYNSESAELYFILNYEQFLILKAACQEKKIQKQEETIQDLIKRIEKLEKGE